MKAVTGFVIAIFGCAAFGGSALAKTTHHHHPKSHFVYKDRKSGRLKSAAVIDQFKGRIAPAKVDPRLDKRLLRAATIAQERAHAHSRSRCWHYVKEALLAAGIVNSRPKTVNAKDAGDELVHSYGFRKLPIHDPYQAPVGAVLVYGARRAAGHVELRTRSGFVSDFRSRTPSKRRLIGIYAKV